MLIMAKPWMTWLFMVVIVSFVSHQTVSAGIRKHISAVTSNVYYLQDYCTLPDGVEVRQRRITRDSDDDDDDDDHDHDHDHDNDSGEMWDYDCDESQHHGLTNKIRSTVNYFVGKGLNKMEKNIKLQKELRTKWKQIFLDPVLQPSIVIHLWRPHSEHVHKFHRRLFKNVDAHQKIQCRILLKLSNSSSSLNDKELGTVVNLLKLNKRPWLNDYRLRIVASDPNMTQYWVQGRRMSNSFVHNEKLPIAIDLVTHPQTHTALLQDDELSEIIKDKSKWLLVELETLNETQTAKDEKQQKSKAKDSKENTSNTQDEDQDEDIKLIVNTYQSLTKTETKTVVVDKQQTTSAQESNTKNTANENTNVASSKLQVCPVGTFDCLADGTQCIPNVLRCNGEDNCGNRFDELFNCGTVNLYYIFGGNQHSDLDFLSNEGYWFAIKILSLLLLVALFFAIITLLCRCCCDRSSRREYIIDGKSPMVYLQKSKKCKKGSLHPSSSDPLLGTVRGQGIQTACCHQQQQQQHQGPPPSYFGNQSDNQNATVHEYIYVNNNYGQPLGSTTVSAAVRANVRDQIHGGGGGGNSSEIASAPQGGDCFPPPMYPDIAYPNYGGVEKQ